MLAQQKKKTRSSISRRSAVVHPTQVHNLAWSVEIELQKKLWLKNEIPLYITDEQSK